MGLFGFGRKKEPTAKDNLDAAADEVANLLRDEIFPGGMQEKIFRSAKVVELSNGKLTPQEALHVYTKVKTRFKITSVRFDGNENRGRTAEDMVQRTIEDSKGKLSYLESVAVNAYGLFDSTDPNLSSFNALKTFLTSSFGSDEQGYDSDEIPFAVGEFGLTQTNPIPIRGIKGIHLYLSRLRSIDGQPVQCKRTRALQEPGQDPIDEYEARAKDGRILAKLYVSPYHQRISRKAPKGFTLAPSPW